MDFRFDVCVVGGCGHVGLPLALAFAQRGLMVSVYDIDDRAVATVNAGRMPFLERGAEPILRQVIGRTLEVANDPELVAQARHVVVVIGTPVDEHLNPTFHTMRQFVQRLLPHLRDGQCVILRSTVYPGTTEKVRDLVARSGRDVGVAFCPERVAQGRALEELVALPQIISGCDRRAEEMAAALFGRVARSLIRLSPLEAELTKIFANVWRYIQFATANQCFMIAADYGLDFYRIHDALTRDYPRMAGLPTSGFAAGPCLFKDTMQLAAATNNTFALGHAAMLVNEGLPNFLVRHLKAAYPLGRMCVGVLGMAFKAESDDPRESRSYKLRKVLEHEAAEVLCTDAYIADPTFLPLEEVVARADLLIIATPTAPIGRWRPATRRSSISGTSWAKGRAWLEGLERRSLLLGRSRRAARQRTNGRHSRPYTRGDAGVKILVTGSSGFIAGYLVEELLAEGHEVVGLDNFSKYGPVRHACDDHPRFCAVAGDAKDAGLVAELLADCDHFVAGAAIIGGISLFHARAYDLLAENERITAAAFDAALLAHRAGRLRKITVVSSSMVYESTDVYPTPEGEQRRCPPPRSTYGFQKLATEYFAQGAREQYGLPSTIVRPFNCIGVGEKRARSDQEILSGNVRLAMSHVVPDLVQKVLKGQDPLHLFGDGRQVRHYTYGGDLARGIRRAIEVPEAVDEDFNLSTTQATTVLELAELIWRKVRGNVPFRYVCDTPYPYDVRRRSPAVEKARRVLGFEATTPLSEALDEVIPWVRRQIEIGGI